MIVIPAKSLEQKLFHGERGRYSGRFEKEELPQIVRELHRVIMQQDYYFSSAVFAAYIFSDGVKGQRIPRIYEAKNYADCMDRLDKMREVPGIIKPTVSISYEAVHSRVVVSLVYKPRFMSPEYRCHVSIEPFFSLS